MAHGWGLSSRGRPVIALLWAHFLLLPLLTLWQPPDPLPVSDPEVYHQDSATSCRFSLHRSAFLSLALLHYNPSCLILRVLMLFLWLKGKLRHLGLLSGRNCIEFLKYALQILNKYSPYIGDREQLPELMRE